MQMRMGAWLRIGTQSPGTLSCFMGEPFLGALNSRRLSPSLPLRASMLPLLMQPRKHSGFIPSSRKSSLANSTLPPSFRTTNPPSHSQRITNITLAPNTSMFVSILFCYVIENGSIRLIYCPTDNMVADTLTKALPSSTKVKHFASQLRLAAP